jgi:hypothetical protein
LDFLEGWQPSFCTPSLYERLSSLGPEAFEGAKLSDRSML